MDGRPPATLHRHLVVSGLVFPPRAPSRAARSPAAVAVLACGVLAGVGVLPGCSSKVSPSQCTEMMDRYVDMTIAADPSLAKLTPSQVDAVREMKKALKKAEPSYQKVAEQCEREIRRHEYRCAMAAKTPNDWEACID